MRKIRDVLRLSANGLSKRKIAVSLGLSATAAGDCIRRAREAGVAWPLAMELTDGALERLLYRSAAPVEKRRPEPDWATVHRELKRAGVTLQLLWEEYRAAHPDAQTLSANRRLLGPIVSRENTELFEMPEGFRSRVLLQAAGSISPTQKGALANLPAWRRCPSDQISGRL